MPLSAGTGMLNSFTNFLHAVALAAYALLVYAGIHAGNTLYTPTIFALFFILFVLKVFGVLVHAPPIERTVALRNALWIGIAIGVVALNFVTLNALHAPTAILAPGMGVTLFSAGVFLFILRKKVRYAPLALALIVVYLMAAFFTCGLLRIGFLLVVASNVLWIMLARVPYLYRHAYHNDLYHLALIVSTFVLYRSVSLGLWQEGACRVGGFF